MRQPWIPLALLLLGLVGLVGGTGPSAAADRRAAKLAPQYRQWLEEVDLILRKDEREAFFALKEDYQRDGFIQKFWESRDPYPETPENEFKQTWYARLEEAKRVYGNITEDRARSLLLHGPASQVWKTDCQLAFWPLEIWHYDRSERLPQDFYLIFYQPGGGGPFHLWTPTDGYNAVLATNASEEMNSTPRGDSILVFEHLVERECSRERVIPAFRAVRRESQSGTLILIDNPPPPRDTEWLATFLGLSTDVPKGAPAFTAQLTLGFPERRGNRTLLQGVLQIPRASIEEAHLEGHAVYTLLLTGEVLKDGALHESFRYRFDLPAPHATEKTGETIPLIFERALRPGEYTLVVRLDDLAGKRSFRESRPLAVPAVTRSTTEASDPEVSAALGAARQDLQEDSTLRLVPPPGDTVIGGVRIEARATGTAIHKVTFALDGKLLLTKANPPYSVDLALGTLPTPHTVRAVGLDAAGREVAADELVLNGAPQRFAVRLREPRRGERLAPRQGGESLKVQAEVQVPDGQTLDRVEIYFDERRAAMIFQPPYSAALLLPSPLPRYVRALATLADGSTAEDLVLLNAPGYQENVDVPLVEVYAAVKDAQGRPVLDLQPADFRVLDGGVPQQVVRWERVTDLPVSVALLIDTSASMVKSLPEAQRAALGFLRATVSPRDKAALVPFNESPRLAVKLTNDLPSLAGALAGLQAERGTVLWDSLVFGLHYLQGVRGQRALLLLTDGGDRSSHFSFDEALEFARRSGVALYTVGLAVSKLDVEVRHHLTRLAFETGGRSFFPEAASDLTAIYAGIQEELRSRYLLVYQPTVPGKPGEYRPVSVQIDRPGVTVEALRGYYP
ncbi:MAG TPA: VWA domain-containing protein [Thermoanaerobaculia bacterium]|nr:VWA domain-containing protein [Thermoanaerobaculia bacterium]